MLKPKYIQQLPERMIELYSQVEQDILTDMARRIAAQDYFIPAAEWQFRKLQEMGLLYDEILQKLAAITGKRKEELERLIKESGAEALKSDNAIYRKAGLEPTPLEASETLQAVLQAGLDNTNGLFDNLTRTTANTATRQFELALDRAWMQVSSGAFDYNTAIRTAVKDLAERGVASITYPSGHTDYMEVAVRRAVVTGINQSALKLQDQLADDLDSDLVETTAHAGARPAHAKWQGKVFSRSGAHPKYPKLSAPQEEGGTGYGTGAGLGGWNCRHSMFPYFEGQERVYTQEELDGMNAPKYEYNGEKLTEYEATQRQRHIERQIRRWKREYAVMDAAGQPTEEAAARLAKWQDVQRDFIKQTGLKRQYDRENIPGFSGDIVKRAVTEKSTLDNFSGIGIIKSSDIEIGRSLGAAAFRDTVKLPGDELSKITEGTTITKVVIFAGKGTKKVIRDAARLEKIYGAAADKWQKARGDGYVDVSGKSEHAELHWYQAQGVGRVEMKVKRWFE